MPFKRFFLNSTNDGYGRLYKVPLLHLCLSCYSNLSYLLLSQPLTALHQQNMLFLLSHFSFSWITLDILLPLASMEECSMTGHPPSSWLAKGMQDDRHISGADPTEMNGVSVALWKHWLLVLKVHSGKPDCLQNICDHHGSSGSTWALSLVPSSFPPHSPSAHSLQQQGRKPGAQQK